MHYGVRQEFLEYRGNKFVLGDVANKGRDVVAASEAPTAKTVGQRANWGQGLRSELVGPRNDG